MDTAYCHLVFVCQDSKGTFRGEGGAALLTVWCSRGGWPGQLHMLCGESHREAQWERDPAEERYVNPSSPFFSPIVQQCEKLWIQPSSLIGYTLKSQSTEEGPGSHTVFLCVSFFHTNTTWKESEFKVNQEVNDPQQERETSTSFIL